MADRGTAAHEMLALADESVAGPWRELAVLRSNPFLTPEWAGTAAEAYPDERPATIVWRQGGAVRGVLPLVAAGRGPLALLRFPAARRADWTEPACRVEDEGAMGAAVARLLDEGWGSREALLLDRLDRGSGWPAGLVDDDLAAIAGREDVLPFIAFDDGGYESYLAARSRNFRSQLGRRRRKLEREHALAFRMTTDPGALTADLDTFFALHDERFASRGEASSQDEGARRHLRLFAAAALERGWLRLWIAEADGAPAAAWYGWRIGERYCYALAGLKESFEPMALGTVLLAHTIEQAAGEGAAIYDLMWGDEGYKSRFETGRREARTYTLTRRRGVARAVVVAGIRSRRAVAELPPGLKEPLTRAAEAVRRR